MLKILNLINACPGYTTTFENWVQEIDYQYFYPTIRELQRYFSIECLKLPKDLFEETEYATRLWLNINNMCKFMKIFSNSNNERKRVPKDLFIAKDLPKHFDITSQYKLFYHKKTRFNLISFPFLMPLDYKYELLKIESIL
jgi:hypothetical protein